MKKVAIYGIGNISHSLVKWIEYRKPDIEIIYFVQTKADSCMFFNKPVRPVIEINDDFDYLVLAVGEKYIGEITNNIKSLPVYEKIRLKIIRQDEFKIELGYIQDVPIDLKVAYNANTMAQIGSQYGGYWIDVSLLRENPIVMSFGVGEEISFDLEMARRFNAWIYAYDPTPKAEIYMKSYESNDRISFYPIGISSKNEFVHFYLPKNENYVSGAQDKRDDLENDPILVEMRSCASIIDGFQDIDYVDVLKMDIEGAEFKVIPDILSNRKIEIKQILIEFHDRFYQEGIAMKNSTLEMLDAAGYILAYEVKQEHTMTFIKGD